MKIIQVMPEFGLAGAETMCENLTYELRKLGHDVIIVSMYDYHSPITERLEVAGVTIYYLNKKSGFDASMVTKMRRIFKNEKPDVVHTHRYVMQYAIPAAIMAGVKKRVHTVHNIAVKENGRIARKINNVFYKNFAVIPVALSDLIQDSIVEEYSISKKKIPIILNGIDLSRCVPKTHYRSDGLFKILHIGRFSEQKNHMTLIQAFDRFNKQYPESELWLIGDGETKTDIETYVQQHDLISKVRFLGLQSNVYGFLHEADIFTLPSNYEGIPMTLIEAMGTGLPIVATPVGGVPDILTDTENALLVENDAGKISNAFEAYFIDEKLRTEHGKKVMIRANDFSAETMAEKYLAVYENS